MRPGVCMECGIEFCRVTEEHTVTDCINLLKNKLKERDQEISNLCTENSKLRGNSRWVNWFESVEAENKALRDTREKLWNELEESKAKTIREIEEKLQAEVDKYRPESSGWYDMMDVLNMFRKVVNS